LTETFSLLIINKQDDIYAVKFSDR
jgi:hypothetical protein